MCADGFFWDDMCFHNFVSFRPMPYPFHTNKNAYSAKSAQTTLHKNTNTTKTNLYFKYDTVIITVDGIVLFLTPITVFNYSQ